MKFIYNESVDINKSYSNKNIYLFIFIFLNVTLFDYDLICYI